MLAHCSYGSFQESASCSNTSLLRRLQAWAASMDAKYYTTAIICLTTFFLYADQQLLAPNMSAIAHDFGFTDEERDRLLGGYIAVGFFIVGAPVALVVGYMADFCNRAVLFGFVVMFGESACFATYWVQNYGQLFAVRVLTGISIGGATPIIFSMLGDLYSGSHRIYVSTFVGIALSAGIAFGQLLAGMVGPELGWRAPFLMIACPSLLLSVIIILTVQEPKRGDQEKAVRQIKQSIDPKEEAKEWSAEIVQEEFVSPSCLPPAVVVAEEQHASYSEAISIAKLKQMFATPSVVLIFVQGFPGCLPWGMIIVFLNDYLSEDRGMTVQAATAVLTSFSVGGLFGQLTGGWAGQRLYNIDPRLQCLLMGASTLLSVLPVLYLLDASTVGNGGYYFVALLGGFIVNMNGPNVRVVLQNVCIPEIRGSAFAVFTLSDDIGKGLGPALVVVMISACGGNRREAFNIVVLFWLFCGTLLTCLALTVVKDEETVHSQVTESLLRRSGGYQEQDGKEVSPSKEGLLSPSYRRLEDDQDPPEITRSRPTVSRKEVYCAPSPSVNPIHTLLEVRQQQQQQEEEVKI